MRTGWFVVLVSLAWASSAGAECRPSLNGSFSFDVRLSALAGRGCIMDVEVFEGPDCRPEARLWGDSRGCSQTDRLALSDAGKLVSILAPATAHREWSIVAVFEWRDGRVEETWLALEDLPGTEELRGVVRPVFDGAAIRFSPEVLVPFTVLESLAEGGT